MARQIGLGRRAGVEPPASGRGSAATGVGRLAAKRRVRAAAVLEIGKYRSDQPARFVGPIIGYASGMSECREREMGMGSLRRTWSWLAGQMRRITGFSTPFGGVQLRPLSDNSFGRAQDERELRDEIWLLAISEAHPYPASAGCPTVAGRRRRRAAPAGMAPAVSWS